MILDYEENQELHYGVHRTTIHNALLNHVKRMRERSIYLIEINKQVYELHMLPWPPNFDKKLIDYVFHLSDWRGGINHKYDTRQHMWKNYHGSRDVVPFPEKHDAFIDIITEVMLNDWGYEHSTVKVVDSRKGSKSDL